MFWRVNHCFDNVALIWVGVREVADIVGSNFP
jgi:hypothetical protein